jgi:hypothetical protein
MMWKKPSDNMISRIFLNVKKQKQKVLFFIDRYQSTGNSWKIVQIIKSGRVNS